MLSSGAIRGLQMQTATEHCSICLALVLAAVAALASLPVQAGEFGRKLHWLLTTSVAPDVVAAAGVAILRWLKLARVSVARRQQSYVTDFADLTVETLCLERVIGRYCCS
jgi:hypothetical protein